MSHYFFTNKRLTLTKHFFKRRVEVTLITFYFMCSLERKESKATSSRTLGVVQNVSLAWLGRGPTLDVIQTTAEIEETEDLLFLSLRKDRGNSLHSMEY